MLRWAILSPQSLIWQSLCLDYSGSLKFLLASSTSLFCICRLMGLGGITEVKCPSHQVMSHQLIHGFTSFLGKENSKHMLKIEGQNKMPTHPWTFSYQRFVSECPFNVVGCFHFSFFLLYSLFPSSTTPHFFLTQRKYQTGCRQAGSWGASFGRGPPFAVFLW